MYGGAGIKSPSRCDFAIPLLSPPTTISARIPRLRAQPPPIPTPSPPPPSSNLSPPGLRLSPTINTFALCSCLFFETTTKTTTPCSTLGQTAIALSQLVLTTRHLPPAGDNATLWLARYISYSSPHSTGSNPYIADRLITPRRCPAHRLLYLHEYAATSSLGKRLELLTSGPNGCMRVGLDICARGWMYALGWELGLGRI
ncbi:hypothetical protein MKEN_00169900 [Mycena kentingensis (nom. inval.)]|nr:hypothetical protein MKEN_00169900 [Mycena kentingensis (nom. inval.)]